MVRWNAIAQSNMYPVFLEAWLIHPASQMAEAGSCWKVPVRKGRKENMKTTGRDICHVDAGNKRGACARA